MQKKDKTMIHVLVNGKTYEAEEGERLSDLLIRTGETIPMPCGGRGSCGKCRVTVNGQPELACRYRIRGQIDVVLPQPETIDSVTGAQETGSMTAHSVLALDVGTTTLALALVSADEGKIARVVTRTNPQRAFGADVMSRIAYCAEHGVSALQEVVIREIDAMCRALDVPDGLTMFASGNATMLHLLFGADPSGMGASPYTPVFLGSKRAPGASLGLPRIAEVISLPCAAAFVGADLTAGLCFVGMPPEGKYRLLIDLGTNAEVVLFSREAALCTAAAAGPCFEGANISCGMSASDGAICAYDANGYRTVGNAPAAGLCGTGLVDVIASLLDAGTIDETGYMACGTFPIAPNVTLTQNDVRQYQLAKSAVCAAVLTLLRKQGVRFDDVDMLYISGGFSAKINVENAVKTGLLPAKLQTKCASLGNSSLLGTVKAACEQPDLSAYTGRMRYVDPAADPVFTDLFIENMAFTARREVV